MPEPAKQGSTASEPAGVASKLKRSADGPILNGTEIMQSPAPSAAATPAASIGDLTPLTMSRGASGSGTDGEEPPTSSDEDPMTPVTPLTPLTPTGGHFKHVRQLLGEHIVVRGSRPGWLDGHMVAERVSTHGRISPMEKDGIPALDPNLRPQIGRVTGAGPIWTWLDKRAEWDKKYAKELGQFRELRTADRATAEKRGFLTRDLAGEHPPLAALAGLASADLAKRVGKSVDAPTHRESKAVALWAHLAEGPDYEAVRRERRSGEESPGVKEQKNEAGRSPEQRASVAHARRSVDLGRKSVDMGRRSGDMGRVGGRTSGDGHRPLSAELDGVKEGQVRRSLDGGRGEAGVPETLAEEKAESAKEQPAGNTLEAKLKRLGV